MALPALPMNKTRKSTGNMPSVSPTKSTPNTPRSGLRAPSSAAAPSTLGLGNAPPQPKSLTNVATPAKTLRKTVSINSFPQPPRGDNRTSSLPPSPLASERPRSVRKSKAPKEPSQGNYAPSTPSLLNGSGEGKFISSVRMSDGLISVSSPTQSRSSSAQDSYSTSATTFDDPMDGSTPKPDGSGASSSTATSEKRSSKGEGKGNVVVSVRVRPDANVDHQSPEGEWMVDGRTSLISCRGKEGGDYHYGAKIFQNSPASSCLLLTW